MAKITAANRPFVLTFKATGQSYPLTSEEAQRLLDEYPAVTATRNRVVLYGHNTGRASERTIIRPATVGGGAAFIIAREDPTVGPRRQEYADSAIDLEPEAPCDCYRCTGRTPR
jgi:hypothetical protein